MNKTKQSVSLYLIFSVVCIDLIGFGIVLPLLPLYAKAYDAAPFAIGLLAISYSVGQFFFNPIWGALSDRVGRRPVLLLSLSGSVIFYVVLGLAPDLTWLFIARIFAGIFAGNISTAMACIADVTSKENRTKGMGMIGAAFAVGFIIGPAIGGFLSTYSYAYAGFGAAMLSFVALCFAIFKLPESLKHEQKKAKLVISYSNLIKPIKKTLVTPEIAKPIYVYFLVILAFSCLQVTFPLFTQKTFNFDVSQNGYTFAFIGIMSIVFQGGLIGKLSARFGEGKLAMIGTIFCFAGIVLLPFVKTIHLLLLLMSLLGVGMGLNNPTLTSMVSVEAGELEQGVVIGASRSLATLARIFGPLWGGWAYGAFGIDLTYFSAGFVLLLAIIFSIPLLKINYSVENKRGSFNKHTDLTTLSN